MYVLQKHNTPSLKHCKWELAGLSAWQRYQNGEREYTIKQYAMQETVQSWDLALLP